MIHFMVKESWMYDVNSNGDFEWFSFQIQRSALQCLNIQGFFTCPFPWLAPRPFATPTRFQQSDPRRTHRCKGTIAVFA